MRPKDEQKKQALFDATIRLVNETGFAASSVSLIAGQANVSPSTLYVFFKNKEDLLLSTYMQLKHKLSEALLEDFDDTLPIRDVIRKIWMRTFSYLSNNPEEYGYIEQFSNSPYIELVNREEVEKQYAPILNLLLKGIEQKIIKNVDMNFLVAFIFEPISRLANPRLCQDLEMNRKNLETAFTMAWDAIKF